jgi:hypothetical protein
MATWIPPPRRSRQSSRSPAGPPEVSIRGMPSPITSQVASIAGLTGQDGWGGVGNGLICAPILPRPMIAFIGMGNRGARGMGYRSDQCGGPDVTRVWRGSAPARRPRREGHNSPSPLACSTRADSPERTTTPLKINLSGIIPLISRFCELFILFRVPDAFDATRGGSAWRPRMPTGQSMTVDFDDAIRL